MILRRAGRHRRPSIWGGWRRPRTEHAAEYLLGGIAAPSDRDGQAVIATSTELCPIVHPDQIRAERWAAVQDAVLGEIFDALVVAARHEATPTTPRRDRCRVEATALMGTIPDDMEMEHADG